jgi:ABC-2 type transport system permease protein
MKTKKLLVFITLFALISIMSPLTARYIQEILNYLLGDSAGMIPLPDPTTITAYQQYISDLYEIVFLVVLFVSVSIFMRDKNKGLTPLIFSKPINRTKYVISKFLAFILMLFVSIIAGYRVFSYYVYFLFDEIFFTTGVYMMLLYFLQLVFISAVAMFASTHSRTYFLAILVTFGFYFLFTLLSILGEISVFQYLPGMIQSNIVHILSDDVVTKDVIITSVVAVTLSIGLLYLSIIKTNKEDIS